MTKTTATTNPGTQMASRPTTVWLSFYKGDTFSLRCSYSYSSGPIPI